MLEDTNSLDGAQMFMFKVVNYYLIDAYMGCWYYKKQPQYYPGFFPILRFHMWFFPIVRAPARPCSQKDEKEYCHWTFHDMWNKYEK